MTPNQTQRANRYRDRLAKTTKRTHNIIREARTNGVSVEDIAEITGHTEAKVRKITTTTT